MKHQAIGFLGGSFDPIHNGHLLPAIEVAEQLQLQQLFLMPNHIAPHKSGSHCNAQQRAKMVQLAVQSQPTLAIDTRELNRHTPSYTIDTLKEIRAQYPQTPICFVMGMDSLINFDSWYQWQDILSYCHLVVCARPGWQGEFNSNVQALLDGQQTEQLSELHQLLNGKIYFQKTQQYDISSTQIRAQLQQGLDAATLLPPAVSAYIKTERLYQRN